MKWTEMRAAEFAVFYYEHPNKDFMRAVLNEFKNNTMKRKAVITHPKGKYSKQFKFTLVGTNSEIVATSEFYNNRHDLMKTLKKYFGDFQVEDKTLV